MLCWMAGQGQLPWAASTGGGDVVCFSAEGCFLPSFLACELLQRLPRTMGTTATKGTGPSCSFLESPPPRANVSAQPFKPLLPLFCSAFSHLGAPRHCPKNQHLPPSLPPSHRPLGFSLAWSHSNALPPPHASGVGPLTALLLLRFSPTQGPWPRALWTCQWGRLWHSLRATGTPGRPTTCSGGCTRYRSVVHRTEAAPRVALAVAFLALRIRPTHPSKHHFQAL